MFYTPAMWESNFTPYSAHDRFSAALDFTAFSQGVAFWKLSLPLHSHTRFSLAVTF